MWGGRNGWLPVAMLPDECPAGVAGPGTVVPHKAVVAADTGAAEVAALEAERIPAVPAAMEPAAAPGHSARAGEAVVALPQLRPQPPSPDRRRMGSRFSKGERHGRIAGISS